MRTVNINTFRHFLFGSKITSDDKHEPIQYILDKIGIR